MRVSRRSLIIGAGMAAATPKLVLADSLIDIPQSVAAAQRWAIEEFNEFPSCRLIFSDGHAHRWFKYHNVHRQSDGGLSFAVAMEVAVTDANGHRAVNTIPVDGYGLYRTQSERDARRNAERARKRNEWLEHYRSFVQDF